MPLETTIKISKKLREQLKKELHYGQSYNDMIQEMFLCLNRAGWKYFEEKT